MDEFAWVEFLKRLTRRRKDAPVVVGDDCAIVRVKGKYILLSSDLFVESIHFKLGKTSFKNIGRRAVLRALSDIVACAGVPKFLGLSLGRPTYIKEKKLKYIFEGVQEIAQQYKVSLVGGDTSKAGQLFLDVWVVGEASRYILRSTAKAGDYIFVTGRVGRVGFEQIFKLKVREIQNLVHNFKINAMIDISDGFVLDLYRILKESKKGALIYGDNLPITKSYEDIFRGEDYEIIFTVDKSQNIAKLKKRYFLVGEVKKEDFGYKIKFNNIIQDVLVKGYMHF
jgi:thiamine-monophosphate kinase